MEGQGWSFVLPYVRPPLSANRRKHWSPAHREYRETRNDLFYLGKHWQQKHGLAITPGVQVDVTLIWYPGSDRVADSDNQTDSLKPILDGLTKAGVWPDDNGRYIRTAGARVVPRSYDPEGRTSPTVILEIREVVADGGDRNRPEHPDGGGRPGAPERPGFDQAHRPTEPVPSERHRRSAPDGYGGYRHQRHVVR